MENRHTLRDHGFREGIPVIVTLITKSKSTTIPINKPFKGTIECLPVEGFGFGINAERTIDINSIASHYFYSPSVEDISLEKNGMKITTRDGTYLVQKASA